MSTTPKSILVTGDVVRDIYVYKGDRESPARPGQIAPFIADFPGGAKSLYRLIKEAYPNHTRWGLDPDPLPQNEFQSVHTLWVACAGGTKVEHEEAAKNKKPGKVWRVGEALGYTLGATRPVSLKASAEAEKKHSVIVLDDAGLFFRYLPSTGLWPRGISATDGDQPECTIIHKMAEPIAQGDLWRALIGGAAPKARHNLIVIVSAEDLRRAGAAISRGYSWESTLSDLCAELNHNPLFQPLLRFPGRLIVNFDCVAAVWFGQSDGVEQLDRPAQEKAMLVYDPTLPEDGWKNCLEDDHRVYGHLSTFTAAIAVAAAETNIWEAADLNSAIERGLVACRELRLLGHGSVSDQSPGCPNFRLAPLLTTRPADIVSVEADRSKLTPQGLRRIPGACRNTHLSASTPWTLAALAENPISQPDLPLYGLAHRIALYGYSALDSIPHAHFGALLSVDRTEMETLRSLTQLILRYKELELPKQPLSIAAFGPPGAGKSFGIKEIAGQILGRDVPILEFNLSQISEPSDLFGAFHQVRDKALKGITPVVFWDEFDSHQYKWLQFLLAPMQDGVFEENGHTHVIGKCIFVFAGATSWDFEHFGPAPLPDDWPGRSLDAHTSQPVEPVTPVTQLAGFYRDNPGREQADQAANDDFRRKKGPDFLSRLDGHINVLGPNRRQDYNWAKRDWVNPDPLDITFPIRRALLLRQFLGAKKPKAKLEIDRDLLRAFLHVRRYRHGVRSLEKIARHLESSRSPFRRANLPPPQVLAQHLDSIDDFDQIYQETQQLLKPEVVDLLATVINEGYNHDNPSPYNKPFRDLDAFLQQSNRAAALRIPCVLALAGLRITPRRSQRPKVDLSNLDATRNEYEKQLTPVEQPVFDHLKQHIEILANEEHHLWMRFHEDNGWTFGHRVETRSDSKGPTKTLATFEKNKATLEHPCLKPFHEMPDDHGQRVTWQDYDRNAVLRYPRIMRLTDFEIVFADP